MSEENVGLVRQAYEAWNRGGLEWLLNHITPASEFRTARAFPDVEAAYRGQEGFTQFLERDSGAPGRLSSSRSS